MGNEVMTKIHEILRPVERATNRISIREFFEHAETLLGDQKNWTVFSFTPKEDLTFRPLCLTSCDYFIVSGKKLLYLSFYVTGPASGRNSPADNMEQKTDPLLIHSPL